MSWKIWENLVRHPYHCIELFVCRIPIPPMFYEENTFSSFPGLGIRENLVCHSCSFLLYAGIQHRHRFLKRVVFFARVVSRKLWLLNHQPWLLPGMGVFLLCCTILFEGCLVSKSLNDEGVRRCNDIRLRIFLRFFLKNPICTELCTGVLR